MKQEEIDQKLKVSISKMESAGCSEIGITAFSRNFQKLASGSTGVISEDEIDPVKELPELSELNFTEKDDLYSQVALIKLNGGLGTGMGLARAKSLLPVRGPDTFLDFIANQIFYLRQKYSGGIKFLLMNSFSTSVDTLTHLAENFPELSHEKIDFIQGKVPKIDQTTLLPVAYPSDKDLEWCPPGHGDIYTSLQSSEMLEKLLEDGIKYLFISNSDNLGATLDGKILSYFADADLEFMMEVCQRTASDKKGGHLAKRKGGGFILRETAQCQPEDETKFQDVLLHRFFNTNNLWVNLEALAKCMAQSGGVLDLPLIRNSKTVDSRDKASVKVWQLEAAMGAAIECFGKSGALIVPRTRFAPVKTTSDLLGVRSDAYQKNDDFTLSLIPERHGLPPQISLDGDYYKMINNFDQLFVTIPSLKDCKSLKVQGPVRFCEDVVFKGKVSVLNASNDVKELKAGTYEDQQVDL